MNQRPGRRLRQLWMRGAVLLAAVLAAGALAPTAQASTLAGEVFVASTLVGDVVTVDCGPTGFSYHVEGTASAPHEGTFTEDGEVVFNPESTAIVSLDATFSITSPLGGDVTGEKHRLGPVAGFVGSCREGPVEIADFSAPNLCYRAVFANGSTETGRSHIELAAGGPTFTEDFSPDPAVSCGGCPDEEDEDGDGLNDNDENDFFTLLGNDDSDFDGIADGNDDANGNGEDDEDEDDGDECPDEDSDGDGEDDEDEDDEDD